MKVYGYYINDAFLCPVCTRAAYGPHVPLVDWYTPLGYLNREEVNRIIDTNDLQPLHSSQIAEGDYCDHCLDLLLEV